MKRNMILVVAAIALLSVGVAAQAVTTTITVTPTTLPVTLNTIGSTDSAPGFGSGSWQANATTVGGKSEYYVTSAALFGRDVKVSELASISYWTMKDTTHAANAADWFFAFYTAKDGITPPVEGSWYGNRINTEPYFAKNIVETANTWTQWVTGEGENNRLRFFDSTTGYFGAYTDGFLSDLTTNALYKDQTISFFTIQTGSAWAKGFTGKVDGLSIALTNSDTGNVNFEATAPAVPEPMSILLGVMGLGSLAGFTKLRKK